jgi:hypothetical protein
MAPRGGRLTEELRPHVGLVAADMPEKALCFE